MKYKKSLIVLSILLVAAIISLPIIDYIKKPKLKELKDFAIQNPETVDSIFLANRTGDYVTLRKQTDGNWTANNAFNASPDKIALLLKTMNKLEAKNPVAMSAQKSVVADLSTTGVKVEIYQGGKKSKTYYVGGTTADQMGTFMYMDGSTIPFVVHIPGFRGYLTSRYMVQAREWRDKAIFSTPVDKLAAVSVTYPDSAFKSFELKKTPANVFTVSQKGLVAGKTKQLLAKQYVALFDKITFEDYIEGYSKNYTDSLRGAKPLAIVTVQKTDGKNATLRVYYKPVTSDTKTLFDKNGNQLVYDTDNYFALIDGSPELITVQDYIFRHVFKGYKDFVE